MIKEYLAILKHLKVRKITNKTDQHLASKPMIPNLMRPGQMPSSAMFGSTDPYLNVNLISQ